MYNYSVSKLSIEVTGGHKMANLEIKLGDTIVSEESPVYLIAEIGINHNGDMQIVKRLIDSAFACDWNCVKFQKRVPDLAVPEEQKAVMRDTPWGRMTYLDYKKKIELTKENYDYIAEYCKEKPISWTASPWDIPSLEFLHQYDIPFIKVASATLTNTELLIKACEYKIPIIISTGMSRIDEVDKAVDTLEKYSNGDYILMHTNSAYPSVDRELNLNCIKTLKERYHCLVGYSGHEYDINPTVIAATLGASVIERHITVDHNMWGTDQKSSLEIRGMDYVARRIKAIDGYLGDGMISVTESEIPVRKKLRVE